MFTDENVFEAQTQTHIFIFMLLKLIVSIMFVNTSFQIHFATCPSTIFTGFQPSGIPHIGNYIGAIQHCVKMQDLNSKMFVCIVDLHALTVTQDPQVLRFGFVPCLCFDMDYIYIYNIIYIIILI